jgi:hypothetical protein
MPVSLVLNLIVPGVGDVGLVAEVPTGRLSVSETFNDGVVIPPDPDIVTGIL